MNIRKFKNLLSGLADSFSFSNRIGLICQRLLQRGSPVLHYVWKKRWHVYCCPKFGEHGSVKEVLAQGAYDALLRTAARAGEINYINAGANVGAFDIAVASLGYRTQYGGSIELNPRTFTRLAFNLSVNGLDQIQAINAGLAGSSGEITFSARSDSVTDCIYNEVIKDDAHLCQVKLLQLSDVLAKLGLAEREFDLLKIDIEGAEYEVVASIEIETLRRFRHIVMELHQPPENRTADGLYKKLLDAGFVSGMPEWKAGDPHELRHWRRS